MDIANFDAITASVDSQDVWQSNLYCRFPNYVVIFVMQFTEFGDD